MPQPAYNRHDLPVQLRRRQFLLLLCLTLFIDESMFKGTGLGCSLTMSVLCNVDGC